MMVERERVTLPRLFRKVADGIPITWLTCSDYSMAVLLDDAGIDAILVGDSLGMTVLGFDSTLPVTMEDMLRHCAAVRRGAPHPWVVGDMPYMSYQPSVELAIRNAGRFMAETGCDAVKLEGGAEMADRVAGIVRAGIPVVGHLGLTPQSVSALGGFRLQGAKAEPAKRIIDDAMALKDAGAFCIILELVPDRVCQLVTDRVPDTIIISLGSGPQAHGQILVSHDALGLYPRFRPRMAKLFADAGAVASEGIRAFVAEVTDRSFPQREHWLDMKDDEYAALLRLLD